MDNGTAGYMQRYQDRINQIFNPQNSATARYGIDPTNNNVTSNYSLSNPYGVGNRSYNGINPSPHVGPGSVDPAGYQDRDNMAAVKNNLLAQRLGGQ